MVTKSARIANGGKIIRLISSSLKILIINTNRTGIKSIIKLILLKSDLNCIKLWAAFAN